MKSLVRMLALLLLVPAAWATTDPSQSGGKSQAGAAAGGGAEAPAASPKFPTPPSRAKPSRARVKTLIKGVARRYGVEEALIRAIVAAESNYNAHAVSRAGAVGLMQLMPATAADYGVGSVQALFDAETNLRTGTRHLKRLLRKYGNDYGRVIMAYNAGEGVVDRTNSRVTYRETLNYTEAVIKNYRSYGGKAPTQAALNQVYTLRRVSSKGQARRLMKKFLDPSLLSLKVKPTLGVRFLNPSLHEAGPESQPMFELDAKSAR
ncbi:lytic transglycosylase domain-containing protein [Thiorhodococcus mannitoliphagus]|uniref:Lytic transglycosylase domain-containing protein n=1 Tax=Thiorhodococcus mannitoliphagus TaxID=329406 RepID=A0A6P1E125_9GAMM|nr:lytic transglycosylase domain-containing protein [Thiorhodococcus mannitoliphagus]NEX22746.1 lytic transglycosylase domain-containing protein [Thiorhodococcus mannitoliphagus]